MSSPTGTGYVPPHLLRCTVTNLTTEASFEVANQAAAERCRDVWQEAGHRVRITNASGGLVYETPED